MRPQEKARAIRPLIEKVARFLNDTDALNAVELFSVWKTKEAYAVNDRIRYNGKLYKVVQAHTSQADWTPDATPALFTPVAEPGEIPVWVQPTGAHDAYMIGDKAHYPTKDDPIYVCTMDYNVYAPDVTGWELV